LVARRLATRIGAIPLAWVLGFAKLGDLATNQKAGNRCGLQEQPIEVSVRFVV
jgi:hypothetical protein